MVQLYTYEPPSMEILLTELVGNSLLASYYSDFVKSLGIEGHDKVLDYCCGCGIISKRIARRAKKGRLVFTDVSHTWLEHAKKKLRRYMNADAWHIDCFDSMIAGGGYDKIVVHYTLHDFPPELRFGIINQLINNLSTRGTLFIREPISFQHGFRLHELVNMIEAVNGLLYEYNVVKKSIAGEYADIKCSKVQEPGTMDIN